MDASLEYTMKHRMPTQIIGIIWLTLLSHNTIIDMITCMHTMSCSCMGFNQFIFRLNVWIFINSFELLVCSFLDGLHSTVAIDNFFIVKINIARHRFSIFMNVLNYSSRSIHIKSTQHNSSVTWSIRPISTVLFIICSFIRLSITGVVGAYNLFLCISITLLISFRNIQKIRWCCLSRNYWFLKRKCLQSQ